MPLMETVGVVLKEVAKVTAKEAKKAIEKSTADVAAGMLKGGQKESGWAVHTAERSSAGVVASDLKGLLADLPERHPDTGDGGDGSEPRQESRGEDTEPKFPEEIGGDDEGPAFPAEIGDDDTPEFPKEIFGEAGETDAPGELRSEDKIIDSSLERLRNGEGLTDKEKGNLCEMMMDRYYISQGYTPLHSPRVTSLEDKGHQGIDGVYERDGKYVIADAKFGSARLGETQDGTQMSREWIDRRLDSSVGKEKADEIRAAYEDDPNSVSTEVYHYDPRPDENGDTFSDIYKVDENGERDGESAVVETFTNGAQETGKADENGGAHDERQAKTPFLF